MMPSGTLAHEAVTALHAFAVAALAPVQVVDGPIAQEYMEPDCVVIGHGDDSGVPSVSVGRSNLGYGGQADEGYDVLCVISSLQGDTDVPARRARCAELMGMLDMALREDPTLGGAVDSARLGDRAEWTQQIGNGALCEVVFSVRIEAHL